MRSSRDAWYVFLSNNFLLIMADTVTIIVNVTFLCFKKKFMSFIFHSSGLTNLNYIAATLKSKKQRSLYCCYCSCYYC